MSIGTTPQRKVSSIVIMPGPMPIHPDSIRPDFLSVSSFVGGRSISSAEPSVSTIRGFQSISCSTYIKEDEEDDEQELTPSIAEIMMQILPFQSSKCLAWLTRPMAQTMLKTACFMSMVSVSVHTPQTMQWFSPLFHIIFGVDVAITLLFTLEAIVKMQRRGVWKADKSYFRDRWCQFDFIMLVCHWISVILQLFELLSKVVPNASFLYKDWFGVFRSPRPLIMVRFVRANVKFQLPKNRIQQIFKRSSQQIYNVTIFFLFFMSLYGILGVQFFGRMDYHCVRPETNVSNVTIRDLAIPDSFCSPNGGGYECPENLVCKKLQLSPKDEGFYGMFNNFGHSVFTVYMAASQEGWVYVMYDCIDSLPAWWAFVYFTTLIFFLAWLVKNVFIAVITETFAEIRVQFSQIWASREMITEDDLQQMLDRTDEGWKLVTIDANKSEGWAPKIFQDFHRSLAFQVIMMVLVLSNALINSSFLHKHDESDRPRKEVYYYMECGFTLLFNLECLFKIWCLGWKGYIRRGIHKFEFILCLGSTLNCIKPLYDRNVFTYFQVFRITRLIKASPMLEDFMYKIFGPGKKLGGLILFTMALLIITSSISLQLFCFVPELDKFTTFPEALMSMFQILTQEGWTEIVVEVMRLTEEHVAPLVAIYFVAYHLFVTLIVLSLFVAVILDNLEMDEEVKKVKQLRAREQTTSMRTQLPFRLRIFSRFPDRPQMVVVKRLPSEFPTPKIRESFTRQFADEDSDEQDESRDKHAFTGGKSLLERAYQIRKKQKQRRKLRQIGQLSSKTGVTFVVEESNKTRSLLSDSAGMIPMLGRYGTTKYQKDSRGKSRLPRGLHSSLKMKQMYEHLKENGDLVRPEDSAPKKEAKQMEIDLKAIQQKRQHAEITRNRIEEEIRENHPYFDRPLFAMGRESKFRRICQMLVYAKYIPTIIDPVTGKQIQRSYKEFHELLGLITYLDWTMVIVTTVSCISMLLEKPWPLDGSRMLQNNGYLQIAEYLFVIAMTFELVLKILGKGLFFTPKAVVKDVGGVMTVFIYVTSLIFLIWMPRHIEINSGAQLLAIFRSMRPLRIYTLVPHIRGVVVELFKGFKEILLVTVLLVVLMFIFASFGVQIAGGKLAKCNDPNITIRNHCHGLFWQKIYVTRLVVFGKNDDKLHPKMMVPRTWANPRNFNFDHIGNAMLALFEILSFKGWNVVRDVILQQLGAWAAMFVHIYVFIGCMIGLTLFVGVVIANYSESRGTALLTVDQRRWHDLKARLKMAQPLHVPPKPVESAKLRTTLYELTLSSRFKRFFTYLVLLNSCMLCVPWNVEEEEQNTVLVHCLTAGSAIITLLFAVELLIKVFAFTFVGFWQSRRNRVDLLISLIGIIWILLHFFVALPAQHAVKSKTENAALNETENAKAKWNIKEFSYKLGYLSIIARFFTIAGRHSTLKMLMLTVVMSMFRSFFIIIAMFLLMLFYAYAGVVLFGMVKYGQAVSRHANFRSAFGGLVVLFRIVTGEDWNEIMHDCMRTTPYCFWHEGVAYWQTDCGNHYGAIVYFCSFYLIITYIVLNLLVAIIMENFSLFYSSEEDALLSYADIRNFQYVWNIVDREQKRSIPVRRVKFLLRLLKGRLEVDPNKDLLLFKHMCYEMERLHNGDDVSFHDVLSMLSYRSVDIRKSLQLEELLLREELEYIIEEEVAKQTIRSWLEKCLRRMRAKEQNTSIINSLRATTETFIQNLEIQPPEQKVDEKEERTRKKGVAARARRSSIPEIVGEAAKKFLGHSLKSAPKTPTDKLAAEPKQQTAAGLAAKRATLKGLQLPTCELEDVEEKAEEVSLAEIGQTEQVLPTTDSYDSTQSHPTTTPSTTPGPSTHTAPSLPSPCAPKENIPLVVPEIRDWWKEFEEPCYDYETDSDM